MRITRGPQYSEEFPHIISIKQLHVETAVQITSACTCKDLSQLTQLLCTQCQRNETIHMHVPLRSVSGHLFQKVKVGKRAVSYSECTESVYQIQGSPPLHRPERLSQWSNALKQNHQDQKCLKFNLKSHNGVAESPFSHHTHLPTASLGCQKEKASTYTTGSQLVQPE